MFDDMQRGEVKFFNRDKGYGFIIADDEKLPKREVFFVLKHGAHAVEEDRLIYGLLSLNYGKQPMRTPEKGDRVVFDLDFERRGPFASGWCYENIWDAAEAVVNARLKKSDPCCSIIVVGAEKYPLWQGWLSEIRDALELNPKLLEEQGGAARKVQISLAHGWKNIDNGNPAKIDGFWWWPRLNLKLTAA